MRPPRRPGAGILRCLAAAALVAVACGEPPVEAPARVDPESWKALQRAILDDDRAGVESALEAGQVPPEALVAAVRGRRDALLERLLERGVDARGLAGATALALAIERGDEEAAQRLEAAGADLDAASPSGTTALLRAATFRHGRRLRTLLAHGVDIDHQTLAGKTALIEAVRAGRLRNARRLLAAGASVDLADRDGWTPLHHAAREGFGAAVEWLLEAGAAPDKTSGLGWTPMMLAAWRGDRATVERLLAAGADPSIATRAAGTAAAQARLGGHEELARRLDGR